MEFGNCRRPITLCAADANRRLHFHFAARIDRPATRSRNAINRGCWSCIARTARIEHRQFRDLLDFFRAGDVLVLNDSRVIRARLRGVNAQTGGAFEMLLLEENAVNDWWAMIKPGKRARVGTQINLPTANGRPDRDLGNRDSNECRRSSPAAFPGASNILDALDQLGEIPLPPYITREPHEESANDHQRYQTVFAQPAGSVAAPTAGLHFTEKLLDEIRARGVDVQFITLHVGLGTFAPVKAETLAAHVMHEERYEVSETTARAVNDAKATGRRVIAVGTTSVRVLESVAEQHHRPPRRRPRAHENFHSPAARNSRSWTRCSPTSISPAPRC